MRDRVWSVADLIAEVGALLEQGFSNLRVEGEVTNVSRSARGHLYFTLKDDAAQMDCVLWASAARRVPFDLEDGLAVLAAGSLTIYPARGRFQMVVTDLEPQGRGALQLAFEQLKRKLEAAGLFDSERKRDLPALPLRVGLVTSLAGAALRDMLKVLRRHSRVAAIVVDARVQGEGAGEELAGALGRLASSGLVDVVILARGGGSLEDLWAFNEEQVAKAIAASPVPVISGVGHEVDFTIADFVADVRAATPTQAAEIVVARIEAQERRADQARLALETGLVRLLRAARNRLDAVEGSAGLAQVPHHVRLARVRLATADRLPDLVRALAERAVLRLRRVDSELRRFPGRVAAGGHRRLVDSRAHLLASIVRGKVAAAQAALDNRERALHHLSPRTTLERGYSITTLEGQKMPLKEAAGLRGGEILVTTLAAGSVRSLVAARGQGRGGGRGTRVAREADQQSLFDDGGEE